MRSFAIWYDKKETASSSEPIIDIHINLWDENICGGKRKKVYIDFGFMIKNPIDDKDDNLIEKIEQINLYCPFAVQQENVTDLGKEIYAHDELVNAIFNEDYKLVKGIARYLCVDVRDKQQSKSRKNFIIYQLKEENFSFKQIADHGTLVSLKISNVFPADSHDSHEDLKNFRQYYFRFRLCADAKDLRFISREPKNLSLFQDAFIETQLIDFRLNSLRSCNSEIKDSFAKGNHFEINAVHYLVLRKASDELSYHGSTKLSSRLMENELWSQYINGLDKNVVAYHFKEIASKEKILEEFVILTRFEYKKNKWFLVSKYTLIVVLLGAVSSLLASWINESFSGYISIILFVAFLLLVFLPSFDEPDN